MKTSETSEEGELDHVLRLKRTKMDDGSSAWSPSSPPADADNPPPAVQRQKGAPGKRTRTVVAGAAGGAGASGSFNVVDLTDELSDSEGEEQHSQAPPRSLMAVHAACEAISDHTLSSIQSNNNNNNGGGSSKTAESLLKIVDKFIRPTKRDAANDNIGRAALQALLGNDTPTGERLLFALGWQARMEGASRGERLVCLRESETLELHNFAKEMLHEVVSIVHQDSDLEEEAARAREMYSLCDALKQAKISQENSDQIMKEEEEVGCSGCSCTPAENTIDLTDESSNSSGERSGKFRSAAAVAPRRRASNPLCRIRVSFEKLPTNISSSGSSNNTNNALNIETLAPTSRVADLFAIVRAAAPQSSTVFDSSNFCLVLPPLVAARARTFRSERNSDSELTLAEAGMYPSASLRAQRRPDRRGMAPQGGPTWVKQRIIRLLWTPPPQHDRRVANVHMGGRGGVNFASPVVHIHDVFGDRGERLLRKLIQLAGRGNVAAHAPARRGDQPTPILVHNHEFRGHATYGGRSEIPLQAEANTVMAMVGRAIRASDGDGFSEAEKLKGSAAVAKKTPWFLCQGLIYGERLQLMRHVDGVGSWVVLFSLGLATRFYIDGETIEFQSGDCLVFHGGPHHSVVHGVEDVVPGSSPSFINENAREFGFMMDRRISVQLRQSG